MAADTLKGGSNEKDKKEAAPQSFAAAFDAVTLNDVTKDSISKAFNQLVDISRIRTSPYRDALMKLSEVVAKLHDCGMVQVGLKVADFDTLREYNIAHDDVPNTMCILTIEDTHFLIRTHQDGSIDLHGENLNKIRDKIIRIGDPEYWERTVDDKGKKLAKPEPRFYNYDFKFDEENTAFACTVIKTAALRRAVCEQKTFDIEARPSSLSTKSSRKALG